MAAITPSDLISEASLRCAEFSRQPKDLQWWLRATVAGLALLFIGINLIKFDRSLSHAIADQRIIVEELRSMFHGDIEAELAFCGTAVGTSSMDDRNHNKLTSRRPRPRSPPKATPSLGGVDSGHRSSTTSDVVIDEGTGNGQGLIPVRPTRQVRVTTFPPLVHVGPSPPPYRITKLKHTFPDGDDPTRVLFRLTAAPRPTGLNNQPVVENRNPWGPDDPNYNFQQDTRLPLIAVVTLNSNANHDPNARTSWMHRLSYHNKVEYCKKWGYDLIIEDERIVDKSRDVAWSKIPIFKRWLPKYQYLFWMDMDAFFMRFDLSLEPLLRPDSDVIISKDWHGINMGVFVIRNSPYSYHLLAEMWNAPRQWWEPWEEQSALMKIIEPAHNGRKALVHLRHFHFERQRSMNSYPAEFAYGNKGSLYVKGDYIAHFPNCKGHGSCRGTIETHFQEMLKDNKLKDLPSGAKVPESVFPTRDEQ